MISPDAVLAAKVSNAIWKHQLFFPDDTVIVAVSGGADSTALLDMLVSLPGYRLHPIAAHLNHSLRGAESDEDEKFCRNLAAAYKIPFEPRRVDVRRFAESEQLNLEDAGRRARIAFLDEIRHKYSASAVVLAHHADDQAETFLMRLLRGSGLKGLSGIAWRNDRGYVRPLLEINRSEIEQYLRSRGLNWREDASNSDNSYLRNRIRHKLLPFLEGYNPAIRSRLVATASLISEDEVLLEAVTERAFNESCQVEKDRIICQVEALRAMNKALRRRVLRCSFKKLVGTLDGLQLNHVEAVCGIIDYAAPNARVSLPFQVAAIREYDRISFIHAMPTAPDVPVEILISAPGSYLFPNIGRIAVELVEQPDDYAALPAETAYFDLSGIPFPWLIRTFQPGDRIRPFGMRGRKKVKNVFIDRKIPLSERAGIPLLFCGDELLWIPGICVSETSRISTGSEKVVKVTFYPMLK